MSKSVFVLSTMVLYSHYANHCKRARGARGLAQEGQVHGKGDMRLTFMILSAPP